MSDLLQQLGQAIDHPCHIARPDIGRGRDTLLRDPAWHVQKPQRQHSTFPPSWSLKPGLIHATTNANRGRDDRGRAIAALLKNPEEHIGETIPLSGPVEMDHEQMAEELSEALGRKIVFQDLPIDEYCTSIEAMGVSPYVVQHLRGARADYQTGHMSGADNNVEKLTGRRSMTIGEFARAHLDPASLSDLLRG